MDRIELKKHIQKEIAELNKLEGGNKPRYELKDKKEGCIKVMIHHAGTLVDITGKEVIS